MKIEWICIEETGIEYDLYIGENKFENDKIIKMSNGNDLWFHLEKFSSAHIVLKTNGDNIPKKYIKEIATKFSYNKKGLSKKYSVMYTEIKNVKLTENPGEVIVKKYDTLII